MENAVEVAAALAVKEYNKAIAILKRYLSSTFLNLSSYISLNSHSSFNNDVRKVVDDAIDNVDTTRWTSLRNKTSARDTSVATAENSAREAIDKIGNQAQHLKLLNISIYHPKS